MTLPAAVNRYVAPGRRYLKLLGGYKVGDPGYAGHVRFGRAMADDARRITDDELAELFNFDWRSRLTAGWLVGLPRREHFRDRIGEGGAWQRWAAVRIPDRADPDYYREHIDQLCAITDDWMR